ncbi:MAG: PKD domain-containing protein [Candidatus Zixiibacteriota bacterium]
MKGRSHKLPDLTFLIMAIGICIALTSDSSAIMLCVDAGHGGSDGGNTTGITGYNEKDINLDIALNYDEFISHRFAVTCPVPQANFTHNLYGSSYPPLYHFHDWSTNEPMSWQWDFGDGTHSTLQEPVRAFYAGMYTIGLTAANACGSDDTVKQNLIYVAPCTTTTPDADGDGIGDICDNCVSVWNPGQEDCDRSGTGDVCCCSVYTGNADGDLADIVDLSDMTAIIDFLFFGGEVSCCLAESDADRSGEVDISDMQLVIDYLFFGGHLVECP